MTHWLEEAEREEQRKQKRPARESARIQDKMFRIQQNYEANKEKYEEFIQNLHDLCERANNLPPEKRTPWNVIEAKSKESKLNNYLFYFTSSERIDKKVPIKAFPFVKRQHFKHIRVIYFTISKEMGKAEIEIKEDYLAKTKLRSDDNSEIDTIISDGFKRFDLLFKIDFDRLNNDITLPILDWLAFKNNLKDLPFSEEDFKFKDR